jgi:hypothetical protein
MAVYNETTAQFEAYEGGSWLSVVQTLDEAYNKGSTIAVDSGPIILTTGPDEVLQIEDDLTLAFGTAILYELVYDDAVSGDFAIRGTSADVDTAAVDILINAQDGGDASTGVGQAGGAGTLKGGTGGAAVDGFAAGLGGQSEINGGTGGAGAEGASPQAGGIGGAASVSGGTGGAGTTSTNSGAGGDVDIIAGNAGADGGFGQNAGGDVNVDAGTGGSTGAINIGTTAASAITLGNGTEATITSTLLDNTASAYVVKEGSNNYIVVTTTNASEDIVLGNATTNPAISQSGTGQVSFVGNVDAANGLDVTNAVLSADTGLTVSGGAFTFTGSNLDLDPTGGVTLDMDSAQTIVINLSDNVSDAISITQGANTYFEVTTTNSAETITLGNATTNPTRDRFPLPGTWTLRTV